MRIYRIKPNYRLPYRLLVILANFLGGLVSVLTLGLFSSTLIMGAHKLGMYDHISQLKIKREKEARNNET